MKRPNIATTFNTTLLAVAAATAAIAMPAHAAPAAGSAAAVTKPAAAGSGTAGSGAAGAKPAAAEPANHASALLTPELAQKVLGKAVDADSGNGLVDYGMGNKWVSKSSYRVHSVESIVPSAGLVLRHVNSAEEAKTSFLNDKRNFQGVEVKGLGAEAFRTKSPPNLRLLKGKSYIIISVGTVKEPDTNGQEKIAKEILPKVTEQ